MHYPVVHISHMDAETFCQWSGKRLPTEAEWEFAARGGLKGTPYPWGDDFSSKRTNLWQGLFPLENKMYDGYKHLSPVDAFEQQNTYGMYDVLGNTWEWTATPFQRGNIGNLSLELSASYPGQKYYVLKGASFIDFREETAHINHAARLSNRLARPLGFTSQNIGFRCAQDYKPAPRPPTIHTLPGKSDPEAPKVTVLLNRKEEL
ncbi:SUMF2 [Bugula neritina]|uniref:SUMF2 n=1 Tax=Bugula neritina TaxID=10212 RepID=A0A7J7JBC4_BUGNE|nr:SUMF2 [Bugula neritina]